MEESKRNSPIVFIVLVVIGALFAWAGSQHGGKVAGLPVFALLAGLAFLIQWLAFIPAYIYQTEKFFDITGSFTYIALTLAAFFLSPNPDVRAALLTALVVVWALRLGTFLFTRIQKAGQDDRFDEIKPRFFRFLNVWTIQALWVTFTAAAAWIAITSSVRKEMDCYSIIGALLWLFGFIMETAADAQKSKFNADPANKGKFINTGLWARSRHPNYFGEIVLWVGIAVMALPVLQGWQWVALISPLFVTLLLTRVSGVPLLEQKADKKWGGQEDYENYKKNTPVLIPKLFIKKEKKS